MLYRVYPDISTSSEYKQLIESLSTQIAELTFYDKDGVVNLHYQANETSMSGTTTSTERGL